MLQAAVTILVALAVGVGALLASQAASGRQSAGPNRWAAQVEAAVQEQLAFRLATSEEGTGSLADGDRYRTRDGAYDVGRRLAAIRQANPDLVALDPDAAQAVADRLGNAASNVTAGTVILVLAYLIVALMWSLRTRHHHRPDLENANPGTDVGLIPQPWSAEPGRREATTVALLAWILLTLLSGPQLYFADREQRGQSLATRDATNLSTSIAASSVREGFRSETLRANLSTRHTAREIAQANKVRCPTSRCAASKRFWAVVMAVVTSSTSTRSAHLPGHGSAGSVATAGDRYACADDIFGQSVA